MNNLNIKFLEEQLDFIIKKLNKLNIDYYLVGAIGAYLDAGISFQRNHEDIDILIYEKDINKISQVFTKSDYIFLDNRFSSKKILNSKNYTEGEHEVCAKHIDKDFHIGFFLLEKDQSSYSIIEYFKEYEKQKKIIRTLPIKYFKYQYNDNLIYYNQNKIKVVRKELIFKNKLVMNREKDLFDIEKLKDFLDIEIYNNLKGLSKIRKISIIELD